MKRNVELEDKIYEEGKNALEDELADKVINSYNFYVEDRDATHRMAIALTAADLNISIEQVERYI